MPKPRTQPDHDAARAGAQLTDALIDVAAEYARDQGLPDAAVVGALVKITGCSGIPSTPAEARSDSRKPCGTILGPCKIFHL